MKEQSEHQNSLRSFLQIAAVFLLCFLIVEICVRIYLHHHLVYDVEMSRYAMTLKIDSPDRRISHVHKPNAQAKLMGVWVRTNAEGFRGPQCPVARCSKKRLMFLGDSLTFGWGVEEQDTFTDLLESKLNAIAPTEIINTASGNYNVEMETHLFLEKGLKYHPDKVVLFYFIRDAEPTPQRSKFWFLGYSELITLYWSRFHMLMVGMAPAKKGYRPYYSSLYRRDQPGLAVTFKNFLLLRDTCQKHGIALQVVLLPELHQLINYPFAQEHHMVMDFLKTNSIDALDLAPYFSNYKDPMDLWVAPDDAHPNKKADRLFAQYAFDFIKNGLFQGGDQ
jgi:lysophospholipase L1-like esterase